MPNNNDVFKKCKKVMQEKQFLRFNNNRNNEIIFYTRNGQLFRPMCVKTPHIDVVDQTNNCYKDIPVRFANKSKRGFLLNNDIINFINKKNEYYVNKIINNM